MTAIGIRRAAELQVVLEGVPLPASRRELLDYARRWDAAAADDLQALPARTYRSLDEVGEALAPIAVRRRGDVPLPRPESGDVPGGPDYLDPRAESGAVRPG